MMNDKWNIWKQIIDIRHICLIALSFIIFHLSFSPVRAQVGTWRNYLAYHDVQSICKADDNLFVLASNGLYQYNLNL